jgi:hypothetical protein
VWDAAIAGYLVSCGLGPVRPLADVQAPDASVTPPWPPGLAREVGAFPLERHGATLVVAMADPSDEAALEELRTATGAQVRPVLARYGDLERTWSTWGPSEGPAPDEEPVVDLTRKREDDPGLDAEPLPLVRRRSPPPSAVPSEDQWATPPSEPPPPLEVFLEAIATAPDRDTILERTCDGAVTVAKRAVFLARRPDVLRGVLGRGPGVEGSALRNLSVSLTHASVLEGVVESGEPHDGPHGEGTGDAVFRAAIGSSGDRLVVVPVQVGDRIAGLLCADGVDPGADGAQRLATLAGAAGDALYRLVLRGKHAERPAHAATEPHWE